MISGWKKLKKVRNPNDRYRPSSAISKTTPIQTYPDRYTEQPRLPYTVFAYGTLPASEKIALHYIRIRPYMGGGDPVIRGGIPERQRLLQAILASTLAPENKQHWRALLGDPPTHVLRFGYVWKRTGRAVDVAYIKLNLFSPGHSSEAIARECAKYLIEQLKRENLLRLLCPTADRMKVAQIYWVSMLFLRWRWLTHDRYKTEK